VTAIVSNVRQSPELGPDYPVALRAWLVEPYFVRLRWRESRHTDRLSRPAMDVTLPSVASLGERLVHRSAASPGLVGNPGNPGASDSADAHALEP
jgi:hypothetical protein